MPLSAEIPVTMGGSAIELYGDSVDATYTALGVPIDLADYHGFSAARWEIVYDSTAASISHVVDLVDENGTVYASLTLPAGQDHTRTEVSFTPSGSHTYSVKIHGSLADPYALLLVTSTIWLKVVDSDRVRIQILLEDAHDGSGAAGVWDNGTTDNLKSYDMAITTTTYGNAASSVNFTNGDEFSIRVKVDSGKTLYLYSVCLFVTLDCAEKCQVYVPLGTIELTCIGTGFFDLGSRVKLNTSGAGATWFYEATAKRSGSNPQDTRLKDAGVNDSGISGTSDVTGSALSPFPTTGFARLRSGALTFTDGHRLMVFGTEGPGFFEGLFLGLPAFVLAVIEGTPCRHTPDWAAICAGARKCNFVIQPERDCSFTKKTDCRTRPG